MNTQGITFSEMMQSTVITRIVNRIHTPLSLFQQFFGRVSGASTMGMGGATDSVKGREAGWDIFDATRQFATAKAPGTGPTRVRKKPIGHVSAQLMRSHESILIHDEEVYKTRPLGGQIGSMVDIRGQAHITRQVKFMMQRFRNQREWMYSRMLRGGFNLRPEGDVYHLEEYDPAAGNGSLPINYQIPAENQGRLDLGTGNDILTDWSNPGADIIGQLYRINKAFNRLQGRPLRHIWLTSETFLHMQNNTRLHAIGGDAYRVFDSLKARMGKTNEGIQDTGFDVVWRALPLFTFHVYDGVMSSDGVVEGISLQDTTPLIEPNHIICTPEPDDTWEGLIDGSEVVASNVLDAGREIQGFGNWSTRVIDPPGWELKFLDNYLPVLYVPRCIAYGNVGA